MAAKKKVLDSKKEEKIDTLTLEKLVKETLEKLGVDAKASLSEDKENGVLVVDISSEKDAGLLIGYRGENIYSLELFIRLMLSRETGSWLKILVNVGDWRQRQENYLRELANQTAQRALQTGQPQSLYNLNPSQRRTIHLCLKESGEVTTESTGEGNERYLVVKPLSQK